MKISFSFQNYKIYKKRILFFAYSLFLFALSNQLIAQETVFHTFRSNEKNQQLENILFLTAGVELSQTGLSSTREKPLADYILLTDYTANEIKAHIKYILTKSGNTPKILAEMDYDLPIDYDLDRNISNAIKDLLKIANIKIKKSSIAEIKGLETTIFSDKYKLIEEAFFSTNLTASGMVFFGEIADYFHYAVSGLINMDFIWPGNSLAFGTGLQFSYIRAIDDPETYGGKLHFITAGPRIQISSKRKKPFRFFGSASGGAAVITVQGDEETLSKTVPYADASLNISVPFKTRFFWEAGLRFLTIFDNDVTLFGISPGVSVGMEF